MTINKNYIIDLVRELLLLAETAKAESEGDSEQFQRGRCFGLYEALNLVKQQAVAFGISDSEIGLDVVRLARLLDE